MAAAALMAASETLAGAAGARVVATASAMPQAVSAGRISVAMRPKPQSQKPPSLADFSVPTAEEGREVLVIFGEVWIDDPNVLAFGDLRTTPIKAKGGK